MWRSELHHNFREKAKPQRLSERLLELTAQVAELLPPEKRAINEQAIAEIRGMGVAERALKAGAQAPEFELPDHKGKLIRSADLLARGKLMVVFFRGRWCPYCVTQLEMLNEQLPQFAERGMNVVAISPQNAQQTEFTVGQHKLKFPVLCDAGNRVARQFGIVYRVPEALMAQYKKTFINLPRVNGDESWELPLAATFVVEQDGRISFAQAAADWRKRAEISF